MLKVWKTCPPTDLACWSAITTQTASCETLLIPYFVREATGKRLRPLADRQFDKACGPERHLLAAFGGVVGSPESASALMREDEPILVFPGGGRELGKF